MKPLIRDLLLVGPLPKKKAGGIAIGFESLVTGVAQSGLSSRTVDLAMAGEPVSTGKFSIVRCMQLALPVLLCWVFSPLSRVVYMTIGCSKAGLMRDAAVILVAALLRRKIVLHLKSGGYYEFYAALSTKEKKFAKYVLSRATKIIALGDAISDQFDFLDNSAEQVVVIENGPPQDIAESDIRPLEGLREKVEVIYLSNMIPSKGYLAVLRAAQHLKSRGSRDFRFHFCGGFLATFSDDGDGMPYDRESFYRYASELGLSKEECVYHGSVSGAKKFELLRESDAFILPTNYLWEGQPISIIEAMAFGNAIVATPWKSIVDQVDDGINGIFVEFDNDVEIAAAVENITSSGVRLDGYRKAAREKYLASFTREKHLRDMIALFESTILAS